MPYDNGDRKWYCSILSADTPLRRLVELVHSRWPIEPCYEDAKSACGLDPLSRLARGWAASAPRAGHAGLQFSALPALDARCLSGLSTPLASAHPCRLSTAKCSSSTPGARPRCCAMADRDQPDYPVRPRQIF
jgi:hypothetical protein